MDAEQLPLPEPPDTETMWREAMAVRNEQLAALTARWDADQLTTGQYLNARDDIEDQYNHEASRIDRIYRQFYGVR